MDAIAGGARHVFDYLADEVLARQPEDVREFLLKASIVETLSGPVRGAHGHDRRAGAREAGGGIICSWCRWMMRALLPLPPSLRRFPARTPEARNPDAILELHHRAGLWEEADGCLSGAIEHTLAWKTSSGRRT